MPVRPADRNSRDRRGMKTIPLTQGQQALVDDDDYASLSKFQWFAKRDKYTFYAARRSGKHHVTMHRILMQAEPRVEIDHKDGDGLNNQRYNLRRATHAQNLRGARGLRATKTSKYRGVCFQKNVRKWRAGISFENKKFYLGFFESEFSAALAYDKKCRELFGLFASPNFLVS